MKMCNISNCLNKHPAKGYCKKHYKRVMLHGDANKKLILYKDYKVCTFPGCNKDHLSKGYCISHYRSILKPHKVRESSRRRRAQKLNNGSESYTELQVLEKHGTDCYLCGNPIDMSAPRKCGLPGWQNGLHIEHVIDLALGGSDTLQNVRGAHAICNLKKKPRGMV
jgi:5-methylcytosine-specific restriction endonuclease McrA